MTALHMRDHVSFRGYTDSARAFLFSTFSDSLRETPGMDAGKRSTYERALERALRAPDTRTALVTPSGSPDELLGWAVSVPTALVYVYVRFPYRRGKLLGMHLGTDLIERVTGDRSTPVALWTLDASRMAAHGYPIRFDLDEHERFKQLAR